MPTDRAWLDSLTVRPISPDIDLSNFRCHPNIDWWLMNVAMTMHEKRLSYVTCWLDGKDLAGYVGTAMSAVEMLHPEQREQLGVQQQIMPTGTVLKSIAALLIGMLGTCERYTRRGLGTEMVMYAVGQAVKLSETVGCRFVTVESDKTEEALGLYRSCGFGEVVQKKAEERKTVWMYRSIVPPPEPLKP